MADDTSGLDIFPLFGSTFRAPEPLPLKSLEPAQIITGYGATYVPKTAVVMPPPETFEERLARKVRERFARKGPNEHAASRTSDPSLPESEPST